MEGVKILESDVERQVGMALKTGKKIVKAVKATRTNRKNTAAAVVQTQSQLNLRSRHQVRKPEIAFSLSMEDKKLLKELKKDGMEFYQAIDSEADRTKVKALYGRLFGVPRTWISADEGDEGDGGDEEDNDDNVQKVKVKAEEATIYMVSNRREYLRLNPTRYGVREVKINTTTHNIRIGGTELHTVPRVADENVLLFVHGFNMSITHAAQSAWKLGHELQGINKIVFFSWPSKARTSSYWEDYQLATDSVSYVVECIKELSRDRPGKIHIVAHSMGCRLLLLSLINYINRPDAVQLGQVYFIAGDVDHEVFNNFMTRLDVCAIATNHTNIASSYDYALIGSASWFVHNKYRVGLYPPVLDSHKRSEFMSLLRVYPNDKSDSHSYYHAEDVRADISNQVVLYRTSIEPKPADIRASYTPHADAKNALFMQS